MLEALLAQQGGSKLENNQRPYYSSLDPANISLLSEVTLIKADRLVPENMYIIGRQASSHAKFDVKDQWFQRCR